MKRVLVFPIELLAHRAGNWQNADAEPVECGLLMRILTLVQTLMSNLVICIAPIIGSTTAKALRYGPRRSHSFTSHPHTNHTCLKLAI